MDSDKLRAKVIDSDSRTSALGYIEGSFSNGTLEFVFFGLVYEFEGTLTFQPGGENHEFLRPSELRRPTDEELAAYDAGS